MNPDHKKTVLRMIPYGIYVLTSDDGKGNISAATVNWVTQTAFTPPLLVVGVKTDSGTYQTVKTAQTFALNMMGKDQQSLAFTFFRPADVSDGKLSGQSFRKGTLNSANPCRANPNRAIFLRPTAAAKAAGLDAVIANGGTVTHHHAVGRDHRQWYDRQRPSLFAAALKAAKATLDPQGLLNPGVL